MKNCSALPPALESPRKKMERSCLRVLGIPEVNEISSKVTSTSLGLVTFCLVFLVCTSKGF